MMLDLYGRLQAVIAFIEKIELGPIEPVGEPGDGSIPWQRVLRVETMDSTLILTLMAEDRSVLEF